MNQSWNKSETADFIWIDPWVMTEEYWTMISHVLPTMLWILICMHIYFLKIQITKVLFGNVKCRYG